MISSNDNNKVVTTKVFVVQDNIDTDQIIPADRLALVPTIPEEYKQLGTYALEGLPRDLYPTPFVNPETNECEYGVIVAGKNFGCGSSREHAPIALGAAGVTAVVALGYARIYLRNCIATGEVYPMECDERLCDKFETGDEVTINLEEGWLQNNKTNERFTLNSLGEVQKVIEVGGIFNYARQTGLVATERADG